MLEELNKVLKKIFSNEETIIFSFALLIFFHCYIFLWISFDAFYDKYNSCLLACRHAKKDTVL